MSEQSASKTPMTDAQEWGARDDYNMRDYYVVDADFARQLETELSAKDDRIAALGAALKDMLNGWRYIREVHGDLYGVGWDRAENNAVSALEEQVNAAPRVEWYYDDATFTIYSQDFSHDAALNLSGDFASVAERNAFGERIASMLNAAPQEPEATPAGAAPNNVVPLPCITTLDLDADTTLQNLIGKLDGFALAGYDKNGEMFFSSTYGNLTEVYWLLSCMGKEVLDRRVQAAMKEPT